MKVLGGVVGPSYREIVSAAVEEAQFQHHNAGEVWLDELHLPRYFLYSVQASYTLIDHQRHFDGGFKRNFFCQPSLSEII